MCGIAGWFGDFGPADAARSRLAAMVAAIAHRGPDGQGQDWFARAALGHARLSIIDLATGYQPMQAHGTTISFNGEIYNYRALRKELMARGVLFHTESDTEVILALYRLHGWRGWARLRGMYAFALWDDARQLGYLVRDPLGIKPLFLAERETGLLFASEAKGILAAGALPSRLDEGALHLVMNFRYLPGTGSLFRGIRQLSPGQVLIWSPDGWRIDCLPAPQPATAVAPLAALRESVAVHLTADVEVGAYLSGGLDSATVVALARAGGLRRTFTLAVGDDPAEADNAAISARLLGVDNFRGEAGGALEQELPKLIRALEVPKINALQVSRLAELAAGQVKVVLSGLGGDELFLGYQAYRILARAAWLQRHSPRWINHILGDTAAGVVRRAAHLPWTEAERAARMLAALGAWPRVYGLLRNLWDRPDLRRLIYGPRLLDAKLPDPWERLEATWPEDSDPVTAAARFEWREKMVNDLLWQEDRVSMARGLEVRVPFLDQPLAGAVGQLGREALMPGGQLKGLLREVLQPVLPALILNRPKSGFQVDAPAFFHQQLKPLAQVWLSDARLRETGLFNPVFIQRVLACRPGKATRWHYFMLYLMLMSQLWLDEFEQS